MAEVAPKGQTTASRHEERGDAKLPALRVRYFRQMKLQRVYPVEVYWQKTSNPAHAELTARLIVAGAQVMPSEQTLNSAEPASKAVFYVTPLAKGWLPSGKLLVFAQGRKVQEIPMATKVVSQRLTWFLLLCTLFVPWFITEFLKMSPMAESHRRADDRVVHRYPAKEVEDYIAGNVPAMPEVFKGNHVDTWLLEGRSMFAKAYQKVIEIANVEPIAFYAGVILLVLTLISAFVHKPKRGRAAGKPLQIATRSAATA